MATEKTERKDKAVPALVVSDSSDEAVTVAGVPSPPGGYKPGVPVPIKKLGLSVSEAKRIAQNHPGAIQFIEGGEK
ncbi:MAG: hypothetical protein WC911_03545 [Thermoleophilia bacterium]